MSETGGPLQGNPTPAHSEQVHRSLVESGIYLLGKIAPVITTLVMIRVLTSWYEAEEYGKYATILALGMLLTSFGVGWLQMALLRLYPQRRNAGELKDLVFSTWFGCGVTCVAGVVVCVVLWMFRNSPVGEKLEFGYAGWTCLVFLSTLVFVVATTFLRVRRQVLGYSVAHTIESFGKLGAVIGMTLIFGAAATSLLLGYSAAVTLVTVGTIWWVHESAKASETRVTVKRSVFPVKTLQAMFAFGFPLSLAQFCSQFLNLSDRYLITVLVGEAEAGVYSVGYDLADLAVRLIILSVNLSAYTAVLECFEKQGRGPAERLATSLSRVYLILACPIAVGCGLVANDVIVLLADPEYARGGSIMVWVAGSTLLMGLTQFQNLGLHIGHRTGTLSLVMGLAAVANVVLNVYLIPFYGYQTAAYTTLACYCLLAVVFPFCARDVFTWRVPWRCMGRIGVALTGMSIAVDALGFVLGDKTLGLMGRILVGAIVYSGILILLGEIPKQEIVRFLRRTRF